VTERSRRMVRASHLAGEAHRPEVAEERVPYRKIGGSPLS